MFDGPKSNFTETAVQRRIKSVEGKRNISIFGKLRAQATSSKLQTPSSKEAPGPKDQTPSSKLQRSSNLQPRSAGRGLELGTWDFFGVWSLVFGVLRIGTSQELGIWSLVFRSALQSPEIKKKSRIAPAQW